MSRCRLYLSGPMTGIKDFNRPEFVRWAGLLRDAGFEVVNPAELPHGWTWEQYMERAQRDVVTCHGIALLPGYLNSKGACMELGWALDAGMPYAAVRNWHNGLVSMSPHGGSLHAEQTAPDPLFVESAIVADFLSEVNRARSMFPRWPTDPIHAAALVAEECGELQQAVLEAVYEPAKLSWPNVRVEAIHTAAMCIRFLSSLDKYVWLPSRQHKQDGAANAEKGEG